MYFNCFPVSKFVSRPVVNLGALVCLMGKMSLFRMRIFAWLETQSLHQYPLKQCKLGIKLIKTYHLPLINFPFCSTHYYLKLRHQEQLHFVLTYTFTFILSCLKSFFDDSDWGRKWRIHLLVGAVRCDQKWMGYARLNQQNLYSWMVFIYADHEMTKCTSLYIYVAASQNLGCTAPRHFKQNHWSHWMKLVQHAATLIHRALF